jgi:hypothetical protein
MRKNGQERGVVLPIAALAAAAVLITSPAAEATDAAPIVIGEVSTPPMGAGIDVAGLRNVAEGAIRQIDATTLPKRQRPVVVSFAVTRAGASGPVVCTVNAMVRDAKTGTMLAIIEANTSASGPASAELKKQVAEGAIRSAVRRIPSALGAAK